MTSFRMLPLLALVLLLPSCTPGPLEVGIVALVVLLLFGGSQLPKLMRGMGSGINEFKRGLKEGDSGEDDDKDEDDDQEKTG